MNSCTSVAVKGWSIGLVTAIVDGESQSSNEVTDCLERYTSWFLIPWFKEWKRERECACNWAARYCHATEPNELVGIHGEKGQNCQILGIQWTMRQSLLIY